MFLCVAGVADQLQTNFAGDLRNILKCVFQMSASHSSDDEKVEGIDDLNVDDEIGRNFQYCQRFKKFYEEVPLLFFVPLL